MYRYRQAGMASTWKKHLLHNGLVYEEQTKADRSVVKSFEYLEIMYLHRKNGPTLRFVQFTTLGKRSNNNRQEFIRFAVEKDNMSKQLEESSTNDPQTIATEIFDALQIKLDESKQQSGIPGKAINNNNNIRYWSTISFSETVGKYYQRVEYLSVRIPPCCCYQSNNQENSILLRTKSFENIANEKAIDRYNAQDYEQEDKPDYSKTVQDSKNTDIVKVQDDDDDANTVPSESRPPLCHIWTHKEIKSSQRTSLITYIFFQPQKLLRYKYNDPNEDEQ